MQSADYVPGVSGWKINTRTGEFEMADGIHLVKGRDPNLLLSMKLPMLTEAPEAKPFVVIDGVMYISEVEINRSTLKASIGSDELTAALADWKTGLAQFLVSSDRFAVKMEKNGNGDFVCAGIGLGLSELEKAEAKGAGAVLDYICAAICDTQLSQELQSRTNELSESVRQVLRQELRPGGLLYRR